jgi:hypothetical protein
MPTKTKALTVRLPLELHHTCCEIAKRRRVSLNALIQESLSTIIMQAKDYSRLYEAFGQLGEDAEESEVEFAAYAQWEVISHDNTSS